MRLLILLFLGTVPGFAQSLIHRATLTWEDTLNPTGTTYNVYRTTEACSSATTFSATPLASGVTFKTYPDTTVTPGSYCYEITAVYNNVESTPSNTVTANVPSSSSSLQISGALNLGTIVLGNSISGTITPSGGILPYTFTTTGVPAGVTFSGSGIVGTPAVPGSYSVGVAVTDATGATAATSINFSVFGFTPASLPSAVTSSPYSLFFTAAGGTQPYMFSASGLPPNFSFTSGGWLNGTATAPGTYTIAVTVTDGSGRSYSASLPFSVALPPPLTVPGGPLSNTLILTPYSQTLSATGGAPPYTWSLAGGSFPDGVSLRSGGTITGTPDKAGSYTFSVRVTDVTGASGVGTYSVIVTAQPVTVTTPSPLASGMATLDYPVQVLSATGGTGPYTFTVSANTLPAGLALSSNGAISGTPTAAGSWTFTVVATDQNSQTGSASFQINVRPFSAELMISAGSVAFSLAVGAVALPGTQTVQVQSTDVTKILSWSTAITPAATWLSVSRGGTTPGSFSFALTSAALSLAASATPYQATVVVSCLAPSPCAGDSQTVAVSLLVSVVPPEFTVLAPLLSFTTSSTNPTATTQGLAVQNTGGESIGFASVTCPPTWCVVGSVPSSLGAGVAGTISITANPTGLNPGYYYTDLTIVTSVGTTSVPITFFIATNSSLALNPSGIDLIMPAGGVAAVPYTSFLVSVSGTSAVAWTATLLSGAQWLNLATTSGSSTATAPGAVSYSIDQTTAAALGPGAYYGTIRVASSNGVNSPQDFQVVLNVTAAAQKQQPNPTPAGLIFVTTVNGAPPAQIDEVFASSAEAVSYQASASTVDGFAWLSVIPVTGTTSASAPAQTSISVSPDGLATGVYLGSVSYSLSAAAVRTVNVTLVVVDATAPTVSQRGAGSSAAAQAVCIATQIVPTQTGLVNNFSASASTPTPVEIGLVDDCGNPVTTGQIVTTFSNADSPLVLNLENSSSGLYSGTWTPLTSGSQVIVTATATAPGFVAATARISGAVMPNVAPALAPNGTLHVFTPEVGAPLAPGTIVQIYGSSLATQTMAATAAPLPTNLGGTSVIVGGLPVPLFFVSPAQVNAQLPFELAPGQPYQVIVSNNGALSTPESIQSIAATPGVASLPSGYADAQHASDGSAVTQASPAKPGEYIVIYLAGMGPTTIPVPSGAEAPSNPLARTVAAPTITLNSEPVSFLFSGLTPGLAGLYQIDLQVPADAQDGDLSLVVNQPGFQGSPVILPVHR